MVLFSPTGDPNALIVHEYTWEGEKKVQQAWHRWSFRYPVAAAYFVGYSIIVQFVKNGYLVACTLDPRSGVLTTDAERLPFLDMYVFADVVNNVVAYPAWLTQFDPTAYPALKLSVAQGSLSGEMVGYTGGASMTTVRSFPNGRVAIGFPYTSLFSPTPPMVKDANGVKISSNKHTVTRFMIGTNNSGEYDVAVSDYSTSSDEVSEEATLFYSSPELMLGTAPIGADSVAIVPCRTRADSTVMVVSTSGLRELNLVSLEFVARYHEKIRRAKISSA
jgi:hypothetical protein